METQYPIDLIASRPERSSRLLALATVLFFIPKIVILLPHLLVLWALGIVATVAGFWAQLVVLFTGQYPQEMYDLVVGVYRWQWRVNAFLLGLTDSYPPFTLR